MKLEISIRSCGRLCAAALAGLGLVLFSGQTAAGAANPMPRIVASNGHHALFVDGAPFLMLGAQSHNSSAWPGTLPKVWAAIDDLHANTLEIPVYWEQFEPEQGKFDPSIVVHAYCVTHYIGQVAAAGKAEYPLPMYVNAALRDPLTNPRAGTYESGGATDNVLGIWKAAAPAIDILCPDIYMRDSTKYLAVLDHYSRPDNALFVPETGGTGNGSRMCFAALGRGAIGWSPFGLDYTRATPESIAPVGMNYRMLEPIMREVARLNFEGKVKAVEEEAGQTSATLDFGAWSAIINFRGAGRRPGGFGGGPGAGAAANPTATNNATGGTRGQRGAGPDAGEAAPPPPRGCALVAQIEENQFFITGSSCTIEFKVASGGHRDWLRVEEAEQLERKPNASHNGRDYSPASAFRVMRILNGDETDHALPFRDTPQTLRVTLGTY